LYWDGENFGDWEYGKFHAKSDDSIVSWSGYNWDTSSWVNQPPEPVDVVCDNKACGWIGVGSDRREDDDYNSHCPECDGTEFSWIDYDPDTKEGRANRAKYCKPWDPVESLDKIIKEFPVEEAKWTPAETAPAEKGIYQCQLAKLPTWPWPNEVVLTWTGKVWKNENNKTFKPNAWRVLVEEAV
jgi:hypothetical protein